MFPLEPTNATSIAPEKWNTSETQNKDYEIIIMDKPKVLKWDMKKSVDKNLWTEMKRTVHDMNGEIETVKKTKTQGKLKKKVLKQESEMSV